MKRGADMAGLSMTMAAMVSRMKPLPRHHRIAHLRALIRQQPLHSIRRDELTALLGEEMARPGTESRAT
jgi:hypothetical protein